MRRPPVLLFLVLVLLAAPGGHRGRAAGADPPGGGARYAAQPAAEVRGAREGGPQPGAPALWGEVPRKRARALPAPSVLRYWRASPDGRAALLSKGRKRYLHTHQHPGAPVCPRPRRRPATLA